LTLKINVKLEASKLSAACYYYFWAENIQKSEMKTGIPAMFNSRLSTALIFFSPLAEWLVMFMTFNTPADHSASA
jgi:hypothetical protein